MRTAHYTDPSNNNEVVKQKMQKWGEWCMQPHTEDELRHEFLTDHENLCVSYICRYSKMSEAFIEELLALSTGLLNEQNYDTCKDKLVRYEKLRLNVEDEAFEGEQAQLKAELTKELGRGTVSDQMFNDRVDWVYIAIYQKPSLEFMQKYSNMFNARDILLVGSVPGAMKAIAKADKDDYVDMDPDDGELLKSIHELDNENNNE